MREYIYLWRNSHATTVPVNFICLLRIDRAVLSLILTWTSQNQTGKCVTLLNGTTNRKIQKGYILCAFMLRQDNYQRHNAGDILFTGDDQLHVPK